MRANIFGSLGPSFAVASLLIVGAAAISTDAHAQLPFAQLKQFARSSIGAPSQRIELVRSSQDWLNAWHEMGRFDAPPEVDFNRRSVIVFFDGYKNTGGYSVSVERLTNHAGVMHVDIVESVPGDRCGVTLEAAAPAVSVQTIPWKGALEYSVRQVTHECN